jgi:hypothetical protein
MFSPSKHGCHLHIKQLIGGGACYLVVTLLMSVSSSANAACNMNGIFFDDLLEWLGSSSDVVARTRSRLGQVHNNSALLDEIVLDYTEFFTKQNRAAPVGEIGKCDTVELFSQLDQAVGRFP